MDHLIYNNQCFFSFEEVEQMLDVLYKTGSPVRIYSCLPVERCNQLVVYFISCSLFFVSGLKTYSIP